jgi:peptidylprolyl isomerase
MTYKLSSLALLATLTTAATAQTTPATTPKTTTAAVHHTATTATKTSNIPKAVGIPKTLYALKYIDTKIGTGPLAEASVLGTTRANSKIMFYTVRYTGWFTDGTKFDSSFDHPGGEPIVFPAGVHQVIPGWDSGFQGMHVGGKRRLFIPYQLAYGDQGKQPHIPPKADLIFDIELVSQSNTPPAPPKQPTPPTPNPTPNSAPNPAPASATPGSTPPTPPPAAQPATPAQPSPTPQPQTPPHPQAL